MRSKLILSLAVVALAYGIASASAAPIDSLRNTAEPTSMMPSQASSASGLSALKSHKTSNMRATSSAEMSALRSTSDGLARTSASHAWSDVEALAAVTPREMEASKNTLQATSPPQGFGASANGFAAIKKVSGLRGGPTPAVESLRSTARMNDNLYRRPN